MSRFNNTIHWVTENKRKCDEDDERRYGYRIYSTISRFKYKSKCTFGDKWHPKSMARIQVEPIKFK